MPKLIVHTVVDGIEGKHCNKCPNWKPITEFPINQISKGDGHKSTCKECLRVSVEQKKINRANVAEKNKTPIVQIDGVDGKVCNQCNILKKLTDFHKRTGNYMDGSKKYEGMCKDCRNKKS